MVDIFSIPRQPPFLVYKNQPMERGNLAAFGLPSFYATLPQHICCALRIYPSITKQWPILLRSLQKSYLSFLLFGLASLLCCP